MSTIGESSPALRPDLIEKVTGQAVYITDVAVEGMAHGRILRSPLPHARISAIASSAAAALDGVVAVLTGADLPDLVQQAAWGLYFNDRPVIARDKVRYVGEPVAVVVAETPAIAEKALNLIDVDYQELPVVDTAAKAILPESPLINENAESLADFYFTGQAKPVESTNIFQKYILSEGDATAAEENAARVHALPFKTLRRAACASSALGFGHPRISANRVSKPFTSNPWVVSQWNAQTVSGFPLCSFDSAEN